MAADITKLLNIYNQEHLLRHLDLLTDSGQQVLLRDIEQIDFRQTTNLYAAYRSLLNAESEKKVLQEADPLSYIQPEASSQERKRLYSIGEDCLGQGRVAVFLVAGGQGTRLGFKGPKGCFAISPVKGKSLFQLFAESIRALQRRYGRPLPWYIMTSRENNAATSAFFEQNHFFGLKREQVHFLIQKQIPSLDLEGRLIISRDKTIFKNTDGHGGSISALHDSGALEEMTRQGIEEIFYFQVDNPLVKIADPLFIGAHVEHNAEMSSKAVKKVDPLERVGIIGRINGRLGCIEYSELSEKETRERKKDGRLRFSSANIAVHMLNRAFVEKINKEQGFSLPHHIAAKEIESLDVNGSSHILKKIEGIKFEMFIFDALGFAQNSVTLEVSREEEFSPVKNSRGADSPDTARRAMINLHKKWLKGSGKMPSVPDSLVVEISPLYALDADEFKEKFTPPSQISSPLYLE